MVRERNAAALGGRGGRGRRGFTLLELVLVMLLMATALGIASPNLRGFASGSKLKNATYGVLAATSWARTQAASEGRVFRVQFEEGSYYVAAREGEAFVEHAGELGRRMELPAGVRVEVKRDDGQQVDYVDFYPDGRTDPARIGVTMDGNELWVVSGAPAERFRVMTAQELGGRR
jgi:prepilin-type N-terminal cleavage/methylation domain-containing protein